MSVVEWSNIGTKNGCFCINYFTFAAQEQYVLYSLKHLFILCSTDSQMSRWYHRGPTTTSTTCWNNWHPIALVINFYIYCIVSTKPPSQYLHCQMHPEISKWESRSVLEQWMSGVGHWVSTITHYWWASHPWISTTTAQQSPVHPLNQCLLLSP